MQDQILPYALTTLQRVKDRLFDPSAQIIITGTTNATVNVTGVVTISGGQTPPGLSVGQAVYGSGIPFGTTITAISGTNITLSAAATASGSAVVLTVLNQTTAFDGIITRMINGITDFAEKEAGGRRFAQTFVRNEIQSAYGAKQRYVIAKQMYINTFETYGDFSSGSSTINNIPSTAGMQVGMIMRNAQFQQPAVVTTITAIVSTTSIQISTAATGTQSQSSFQINGLTSFQWRPGTPSSPSWIDFIPDQFELVEDGKAGIIRLYGVMPRLYNNTVRISYWHGYPINWANAGDYNTHKLPSDLTNAVENIVVRIFKRRDLAGKTAEALEGATTTWDKDLNMEDKAVFGHYRMTPSIF